MKLSLLKIALFSLPFVVVGSATADVDCKSPENGFAQVRLSIANYCTEVYNYRVKIAKFDDEKKGRQVKAQCEDNLEEIIKLREGWKYENVCTGYPLSAPNNIPGSFEERRPLITSSLVMQGQARIWLGECEKINLPVHIGYGNTALDRSVERYSTQVGYETRFPGVESCPFPEIIE